MSETKLLSCPFCGKDWAEIRPFQPIQEKPITYFVLCRGCYVETNAVGAVTEDIAIDRWNTRAELKQKHIEQFMQIFKGVAMNKLNANDGSKWSGAVILESLATAAEICLRDSKS